MGKNFKRFLLLLIILFLFIPLKRNVLSFIKEKPLYGSYSLSEKPNISINGWFSGDFQKNYSAYFRENVGFRKFFVRLNNQVQYSFFNKTNAKDVEIGKENYLFEGGYIRDYMGTSFIGEIAINKKLKKLKAIQDELKTENTNLIIAFAPGKASYFPEYFPSKYDTTKKTTSNYSCYVAACKKLSIDFIDFNSYFVEHKKHNNINLFPKGGIHWNEYGIALALDSLSNYLKNEQIAQLPPFSIEEVTFPEKLVESDKDVSNAMNLLFEYSAYKMPRPNYLFKSDSTVVKPKLLIIGDSYGFGLIYSPLTNYLFETVELWYYNKEVYPQRNSDKTVGLSIKEKLKAFDIVLLLSTETNLFKFDFEFSDSYSNVSPAFSEKEIEQMIQTIKRNHVWLEAVQLKAKEKGISLEESLKKNAIFILKNKNQ